MYVRVTVNFSAQDQCRCSVLHQLFLISLLNPSGEEFSADPLRLKAWNSGNDFFLLGFNASQMVSSDIHEALVVSQKDDFSEVPTVLKPGPANVCITVAAIRAIYSYVWGCSPACALFEINWRGSTPIQQLNAVT